MYIYIYVYLVKFAIGVTKSKFHGTLGTAREFRGAFGTARGTTTYPSFVKASTMYSKLLDHDPELSSSCGILWEPSVTCSQWKVA